MLTGIPGIEACAVVSQSTPFTGSWACAGAIAKKASDATTIARPHQFECVSMNRVLP